MLENKTKIQIKGFLFFLQCDQKVHEKLCCILVVWIRAVLIVRYFLMNELMNDLNIMEIYWKLYFKTLKRLCAC